MAWPSWRTSSSQPASSADAASLDGQQRTDLAHRAFTFALALAGFGFVADQVVRGLKKLLHIGAVVAEQFGRIVLARVLVIVGLVVITRHKRRHKVLDNRRSELRIW